MKTFYFAAFMPDGNGYSIVVPDIPNCFTCAETLAEGMVMAEDVIKLTLEDLAADKKPIPAPTSLESVKEKTLAHWKELDYPIQGEILYQLVPAPSLDLVPVKVMVSLPKAVLADIDKDAKQLGFTRSGFIAHAAKLFHAQL